MQCNCGGSTAEHRVVRHYILIQTFEKCTSCGRVARLINIQKPPDPSKRKLP